MKNLKPLTLRMTIFCISLYMLFTPSQYSQAGDFSIASVILKEDRKINVHLPAQYDPDKMGGYNVIYMLDAGNDDELTAQIAHSLFKTDRMPEVIIVAIRNIRRGYDFTPPYLTVDRMPPQTFGNGENFLKFIASELIPQVNKLFNTNDHKIFMGHSWGGLFATYVLSTSPWLFDAFFLYSPALGYDTDKLFSDLKETLKKGTNLPHFIYVSVGAEEEKDFRVSFDELISLLHKYKPKNIRIHHEIMENADHMANPEVSIPKALDYYYTHIKFRHK